MNDNLIDKREIDLAIEKGTELVKCDEQLDLDMVEVMQLYDRYKVYIKEKTPFEAFISTIHDAYLTGVVFGRDGNAEEKEESSARTQK